MNKIRQTRQTRRTRGVRGKRARKSRRARTSKKQHKKKTRRISCNYKKNLRGGDEGDGGDGGDGGDEPQVYYDDPPFFLDDGTEGGRRVDTVEDMRRAGRDAGLDNNIIPGVWVFNDDGSMRLANPRRALFDAFQQAYNTAERHAPRPEGE